MDSVCNCKTKSQPAVRVNRQAREGGERGRSLQYPNKPQKAHTEILDVAKPREVRQPTSSKGVHEAHQSENIGRAHQLSLLWLVENRTPLGGHANKALLCLSACKPLTIILALTCL